MRKAPATWIAVCLLAACSPVTVVSAQDHQPDPAHSWTYSGATGPDHWGALSSEFAACSSGKEQSPINITQPHTADLPPLQFAYHPAPLKVIDNGHTIQVNYPPGSTLTVGGKRYDLVQFHFHHPSEEEIDGQRYAMVAHLVHRSQEGKLAVVAVLIKEGNPNQLISTLWENLPPVQGKELDKDDVELHVTDLLPANHRYYTFHGSLTTPPCSEGVTWYVLATSMSFSKAQIDKFAGIYPLNARPIQPLGDRRVEESK